MARLRIYVIHRPGAKLPERTRRYLYRYYGYVGETPREQLSEAVSRVRSAVTRVGGTVTNVRTLSRRVETPEGVRKALYAIVTAKVPDYQVPDLIRMLKEMQLPNAKIRIEVEGS